MEVEVVPKATDLVAIIALLSQEADLLRERIGECEIRFKKRTFSRSDLEYGATLCAQVGASRNGSIELRIES